MLGVVPGVSDIAKRQSAMGGTNAAAQQQRAGSITVSLGGFGPNLNVSGHIGLIIKIGRPGQVTIVARGPQRGSSLVLGTLTSV